MYGVVVLVYYTMSSVVVLVWLLCILQSGRNIDGKSLVEWMADHLDLSEVSLTNNNIIIILLLLTQL